MARENIPIEARLSDCEAFKALHIEARDGRQMQMSCSADGEGYIHFDVCMYQVEEADIRNLISGLTAIANKYWPKCEKCGQTVPQKEGD